MSSTGRRRAPRERVSARALGIGLTCALLVGGTGAALVLGGAAVPPIGDSGVAPIGSTEPVASAELVCPEPAAAGDATVRVSVANIAGFPGQDRGGVATVTSISDRSTPLITLDAPGTTGALDFARSAGPPLVCSGIDGLAPGLVAAQVSRDESRSGRGLSTSACVTPATSWWYLNGGAEVGQLTRIVVVNPEPAPAEIDIDVYGPDGPVELPATRGIVLTSRSQEVFRLDRLIPGVTAGAIHVVARSGRVAVGVSDSRTDGLIPKGVDWIPAATEPSATVWVPGVSDGDGARQLRLLAPTANAVVSLRVFTASGSFVPTGMSDIDVPQGHVVAVDVAGAMRGEAGTIKVESDQPVVAGLKQTYSTADATEASFTAGAAVMTGPSAVTGLPGGLAGVGRTSIVVWVTAPDQPARVRFTILPAVAGGPSPERTGVVVDIPAGRVVPIKVQIPPLAEWFSAVLTPLSGSVLVAHRVSEISRTGKLVTGYPWVPLRVQVELPAAQERISVGMP